MEKVVGELILGIILFFRHTAGIILAPYATYRRIVEVGRMSEIVALWLITGVYFAFSSLIRTQTLHPFLLTREFILLTAGAGAGYALFVLLIYSVGKMMKAKTTIESVALAWGYTLVPTLLWFWATTVLYVILPPPRTESFLGEFFSILFLLFSALLFFWKIELAYLTLRFSLRLDLTRIIALAFVLIPIAVIYSYALYTLSVFRIPFL
jgi:hypothetical protein